MEQLDLLNSHLLENQFSNYQNNNYIFEKFDNRTNTVYTGFTFSNGLTELLSKASKKINP